MSDEQRTCDNCGRPNGQPDVWMDGRVLAICAVCAAQDTAALRAEIERLRAQNAELLDQLGDALAYINAGCVEVVDGRTVTVGNGIEVRCE